MLDNYGHKLRPLWGKNLVRMGACGLAAYRPKLFRPGGVLAVGPCAPAPVPMRAQGYRDLCGNTRQKTTRFSQIRKRLRISFPCRSLTHRRGVCARVTPASRGREYLCPFPGFTPPHRFLLSRKYFCPPVLSRPFNRLGARGGLCTRPRGNPWHFSIPWFDFHHALMLAVPAEQHQSLRPGCLCQPQQLPPPAHRAHDPRSAHGCFTNQLRRCFTHAIIP